MSQTRVKQVIVMRTKFPDGKGGNFSPRKGKLVSQGAHASMKVLLDRASITDKALHLDLWPDAYEWLTGAFTKVVVSVESEEALLDLERQAKEKNLPCALITDNGWTEFKGVLTITALAIGPADGEVIDTITGKLPLL